MDNNLYVYNEKGNLEKTVVLKNKEFKITNPFVKRSKLNNIALLDEKFTYSSYFYGIFYDKYRNIYYRLLKHKKSKPSENELKNKLKFNYSVLLYDKDFNLLAERMFDNLNYSMYDFIVCKEGFLLSKPNAGKERHEFGLFKVMLK